MTATVEYVYCAVPASFVLTDAPHGIDDTIVRSVVSAGIAALVSSIDASLYSGDEPAERMGDPEWLAPRALAHDAIVTWAADRSAVVPFPMWVMFSGDQAVSAMLDARHDDFRAILDRVEGARELCVRITADRASLERAAAQMDDAPASLDRQAELAPPGQAYLLRRKAAELRKSVVRDAAAQIADSAHAALSAESRESATRTRSAANEPSALLDAAYLVDDSRYEAFRSALTQLMTTYAPAGLKFDFTGPWPPYHFVGER